MYNIPSFFLTGCNRQIHVVHIGNVIHLRLIASSFSRIFVPRNGKIMGITRRWCRINHLFLKRTYETHGKQASMCTLLELYRNGSWCTRCVESS